MSWFRIIIIWGVFFGTLWIGEEGDIITLRLLSVVLAFVLPAFLVLYWKFIGDHHHDQR